MPERALAMRIIQELPAARVAGDLAGRCRLVFVPR